MKKEVLIMSLLITSILLSACGSSKQVTDTGSQKLSANDWTLVELNGAAVTTGKAHLLFNAGEPGKVSGNAGCNTLNGTFEHRGANSIKFSPMAITRMACLPEIREQEFIDALGKVNNWSIVGNQLQLNNGKMLLAKLNAASGDAAKLNGTWELNYISGPRIAFEGLYPDKKPFINFDFPKNIISGNSSCNSFTSPMTINGNDISFGQAAATMMACAGMGEKTFFDMLKKVNKYALTDDNTLSFMMDDVAVMRFTKK